MFITYTKFTIKILIFFGKFVLFNENLLFQAHVYSEGSDVYDVMLNQVKHFTLLVFELKI